MRMSLLCTCIAFLATVTISTAQFELDPRPLDPERDPDIDMFLNGWQESTPVITHGSLAERAILTKWTGDQLKPVKKGQVLQYVNRLTFATLNARTSTTPSTLTGEQEIFYVMSGTGTVTAGSTNAELRKGALLLIPEKLEFTFNNTGDTPLVMYLVNEPVPYGYSAKKEFVINYEERQHLNNGYITVHWSHNSLGGISGATAGFERIIFDPMTIGQPHSHIPGWEEVWLLTEGKNLVFLGKEIRRQLPGMAYRIPPTGFTPHTNINTTEEPCRFLIWIAQPKH
jgi:mannose-6-phosphate isomerase-like protein (cupin superfamily)